MLVYKSYRYRNIDKVIVECDCKISKNCCNRRVMLYRRYKENLRRNGGIYVCNMCRIKQIYGVDCIKYTDEKYKARNIKYEKEDEIKDE